MEEVTKDLKHLIKLQRQRPAFARTISWEFSHTEGGQKKSKGKKKRVGPQGDENDVAVDDDDTNEVVIADNESTDPAVMIFGTGRQHRLSTVESVGDSGSSDESEYYSALEDETDMSVTTDDTFDTLDSLGEGSIGAAERLSDDSSHELESIDNLTTLECSKIDTSNTERRRRPSKKQKRKRRRFFRVTFANEIMSVANIFDVNEDIDSAVTETTEGDSVSRGNRQVPTLVQLCMAVTARKVESKEKVGLPVGMRKLVSGWNKKQSLLHKQLSWLQNHLLPFTENEDNFSTACLFRKYREDTPEDFFLYPTRSVWNGIPRPRDKDKDYDNVYTSEKAASFLLALSLQKKKQVENLNWEYSNFCQFESLRPLCNLSALASAIDLMLPAFVKERSLDGKNVTEQELFSKGFKTMVYRVRLALRGRFPAMVDELFDRAMPYVMWARGNVAMATEMFKDLMLKEKRNRHKAMFLSEIARMNCEFDETETAVKFYRLAAETSLGKPKYTDKDIEEVTEQTQVLLAGVYNNGLITPEKARQSSFYWHGALNLPKQRLSTAVMAIESFLCYHAAHLTDGCWQEEVLARIRNVEKTHAYLKYHASMILALQGKDTESRIKYKEALNGSSSTPGATLLSILSRSKIRNGWQPLLDIVANNKSPIRLLKVVWRRQFGSPMLSNDRPEEGQICSRALNLLINSDGHLAGDIHSVLPPQRDISLDPYTGSTIITHVPSLTAPIQSGDLSIHDFLFEGLFIPTPQIIYSDESGTTVSMVKPSTSPCTKYLSSPSGCLSEPFFLYWQNSSGHTAKINVLKAVKEAMKERCVNEVNKKNWTEEKKAKILQLLQTYYDNNRSFTEYDLERKYNALRKKETGDKKKKKVPKQSKKSVLKDSNALSASIDKQPQIFGRTVVFYIKDYHGFNYAMFLNTRDRKSFLDFKLSENIAREKLVEQSHLKSSPHQGNFYVTYDSKGGINLYNENGVFVQSLKFVQDRDHVSNPCVIGPHVYLITKDRLSVWRHLIGEEELEEEEEKQMQRTNNTTWAFTDYWSLLSGTETGEIKKLKVIGRQTGDFGCLLIVQTSVGLCFLDPAIFSLLPITLETTSPPQFKFSEDRNVLIYKDCGMELRAEKTYTVDDKQITKIAVAVENNILVFEIQTAFETGTATTEIKLIMCKALPGFAVEACFVGKEVGLLVSVTMYTKEAEDYRQNLFFFKLDGHCYGLLPCLGRGKRSFHPVYLHGNQDEGQPGWYVYLRDGHNGIICVKLHDTNL